MDKDNKYQILDKFLDQFWINNAYITVSDLQHNNTDFSYFECLKFLHSKNLIQKKINGITNYYNPHPLYILNDTTENINISFDVALQKCLKSLTDSNEEITKKNVKQKLKSSGWLINKDYQQDEFDSCFENFTVFTSQYNSENHKLYKVFDLPINILNKESLELIILSDSIELTRENLIDPKSRLFELLQAYYTYDLKEAIKEIVNEYRTNFSIDTTNS